MGIGSAPSYVEAWGAVPSSLVFSFGLQEVPFSVKYLYSVVLRCLVFLFLIKAPELRFFSLFIVEGFSVVWTYLFLRFPFRALSAFFTSSIRVSYCFTCALLIYLLFSLLFALHSFTLSPFVHIMFYHLLQDTLRSFCICPCLSYKILTV